MNKKNEIAIINEEKSIQIKNAAWNSLAEESKKAYTYDYNLFFNFVKKDPKNINANDILSFIEHLENNNYKNNSINRKVASLSKMFKVMVVAGEIDRNPVDDLKQFRNISHKVSKSINLGIDIKDIRKAVKLKKDSSTQEIKMTLIIRTLAMTGLRISEFTNIKNSDISDFDPENKIVNIVGKGKKERQIYLGNDFLKEIRNIYPKKEGINHLFYTSRGNPYSRKVLWKQITKFFWKKIEKDVHPHMLRHAYITHKISAEKQDIKAVSRYVGHQDVSITLNMYVDTALGAKDSKIKL